MCKNFCKKRTTLAEVTLKHRKDPSLRTRAWLTTVHYLRGLSYIHMHHTVYLHTHKRLYIHKCIDTRIQTYTHAYIKRTCTYLHTHKVSYTIIHTCTWDRSECMLTMFYLSVFQTTSCTSDVSYELLEFKNEHYKCDDPQLNSSP